MADADGEGTRADDESRDRIDALRKAWGEAVGRLDRRYRRVARGCIAAILLALLTLVVSILLARHEAKQRQNTQTRSIAYRICQREAVDRAFAHSAVDPARRPYVEVRLPILDCRPNLTGEPATPLTIKMQRRFVARFVRGDLTLREQGICGERIPNSPDEPVC